MASNPLSNALSAAAQIRGAAAAADRTRFDRWPEWLQNSAFDTSDDTNRLRELSLGDRVALAKQHAQTASEAAARQEFGAALHACAAGLTSLKWAQCTNPEWRRAGIRDCDIELHDDLPAAGQPDPLGARSLACTLWGHMGTAHLAQEQWKQTMGAASALLELQPGHPSAAMLQAACLTGPPGAGSTELAQAQRMLAAAAVDAPTDHPVHGMLQTVAAAVSAQHAADRRTFQGMFQRGQLSDPRSAAPSAPPPQQPHAPATDAAERERIRTAEAAVSILRSQGRLTEAAEIAARMAKPVTGPGEVAHLDFKNPTPAMLAAARESGIDLADPKVLAELEKLQSQHKTAGKQGSTSAAAAPPVPNPTSEPASGDDEQELLTFIASIPLPDLRDLLITQNLAKPEELAGLDEATIRQRAKQFVSRALHEEETERAMSTRARNFRWIAIGVVILVTIVRVWHLGLMQGIFSAYLEDEPARVVTSIPAAQDGHAETVEQALAPEAHTVQVSAQGVIHAAPGAM